MRKLLLAALLVLAVPTTSQAIVSLGLRLGVGLPAGDLSKGDLYKDNVTSQVPLQLDVMFGKPSFQLGLYVGYAYNSLNANSLPADSTGKSASLRAGVQATSELLDLGLVGVWVGLGTGYEAAQAVIDTPTSSTRVTVSGWEFATLSAGADLKFIPLISVGLYGSAGFGMFSTQKTEVSGGDTTNLSFGPDKTVHQMYTIGLRGALNL
jgi:hypothetical protein